MWAHIGGAAGEGRVEGIDREGRKDMDGTVGKMASPELIRHKLYSLSSLSGLFGTYRDYVGSKCRWGRWSESRLEKSNRKSIFYPRPA
jgi:hypothetical protein